MLTETRRKLTYSAIKDVLDAAKAWGEVPFGDYAPTTDNEKWNRVSVIKTDKGRRIEITVSTVFGIYKRDIPIFDITTDNKGQIEAVSFADKIPGDGALSSMTDSTVVTVWRERIGMELRTIEDYSIESIKGNGAYKKLSLLRLAKIPHAARRSFPVKSLPRISG